MFPIIVNRLEVRFLCTIMVKTVRPLRILCSLSPLSAYSMFSLTDLMTPCTVVAGVSQPVLTIVNVDEFGQKFGNNDRNPELIQILLVFDYPVVHPCIRSFKLHFSSTPMNSIVANANFHFGMLIKVLVKLCLSQL